MKKCRGVSLNGKLRYMILVSETKTILFTNNGRAEERVPENSVCQDVEFHTNYNSLQ